MEHMASALNGPYMQRSMTTEELHRYNHMSTFMIRVRFLYFERELIERFKTIHNPPSAYVRKTVACADKIYSDEDIHE